MTLTAGFVRCTETNFQASSKLSKGSGPAPGGQTTHPVPVTDLLTDHRRELRFITVETPDSNHSSRGRPGFPGGWPSSAETDQDRDGRTRARDTDARRFPGRRARSAANASCDDRCGCVIHTFIRQEAAIDVTDVAITDPIEGQRPGTTRRTPEADSYATHHSRPPSITTVLTIYCCEHDADTHWSRSALRAYSRSTASHTRRLNRNGHQRRCWASSKPTNNRYLSHLTARAPLG